MIGIGFLSCLILIGEVIIIIGVNEIYAVLVRIEKKMVPSNRWEAENPDD